MKKSILLCVVLSLFSIRASAQDPLRVPTLVFTAAATADWLTTYHGLAGTDARELDPIFVGLNNRPVPTVLAGAALDAAGVWLVDRYIGKSHPRIAKVMLYAGAGWRGYIAAHNLHNYHRINPGQSVSASVFSW